jgi:hypothetical protein
MSISLKQQLLTIWCVNCNFSNLTKYPVSLHSICNTIRTLLHLPWLSLPPLGMHITQSPGTALEEFQMKRKSLVPILALILHKFIVLGSWHTGKAIEQMGLRKLIMIYALNSGLDSPENLVTMHIVSWWTIFKVSSLLYKILSDEYKIKLSQKTT